MLTKLRARAAEESGFTLVEILIVIAILGVLSSIVVFAVSGITDDGTTSACKTEAATVRTAQEAYYAKTSPHAYAADAGALKTAGLLAGTPSYVTTTGASSTYTVAWVSGKGCPTSTTP